MRAKTTEDAASAPPLEPEKRDDSETIALLDSEFHTEGISSSNNYDGGGRRQQRRQRKRYELNEKSTQSGPQLQMYVSYLEIYNKKIYDWLAGKSAAPRCPCGGPPTLKLREGRDLEKSLSVALPGMPLTTSSKDWN